MSKLKAVYQIDERGVACNIHVLQDSALTPDGFSELPYTGPEGGCPAPKDIETPGAYKLRRKELYPPLGDQLDAIWKGLKALVEKGETLHPETVAMLAKIEEVKTKEPKHE